MTGEGWRIIMILTNDEKMFLIELLNEYSDRYGIDDEVYSNSEGELSQIWFDHKEHHDTADIKTYKLIHGLLNKLY